MSGSSPQAQPVQLSPTIAPKPSPFYGFAKEFGNSFLPQLLNTPYPSYGGQLDPGLSPTMQNVIRGAQSYASSPFPRSLEQASGTLGAFQNFDKLPGASYDYQFDPSHQAMYRFQQPAFQNPSQAQGPAPDYGFDVKPMAEGGAAGWDILNTPVEVDGYYYDENGLTFNPNEGGRLGDSRWGNVWDAIQGFTGFQPGEQHGPNAQWWDANSPAGFDYGRGGAINPTDPADPNATGYGWWSADPGANGQNMPPWLAGLNDEQMQYVFDLVGNIPPGMRQPSDYQGQRIAGEGLMDWGGPQPTGGGGGGRRGGGGGGGPNLSFQGIPGYAPPQVDASFVAWDPGNPTPTMTDPKRMTPDAPPFFSPPPASPAGGGGGGGRGGGGGGRRPQGPPMGGSPPAGLPPQLLAFIQSMMQGGGGAPSMGPPSGMGNTGFRPGGIAGMRGGSQSPGAPAVTETDPTRQGGSYRFPAYAEGSVVDRPQLAMIGEPHPDGTPAPEMVMPLTRPASDPRIREMQRKLGLPIEPMATGGAAGMATKPFLPRPMPTRTPTSPPTSMTGEGLQSGMNGKPMPLPMRQPNQVVNKPATRTPGGGYGLSSSPGDFGPARPGGSRADLFSPFRPGQSGGNTPMPLPTLMPGGGNQLDNKPAFPQQNGLPPTQYPTSPGGSMPPSPTPGGGASSPMSPVGPSSIWDVYNSAVPVMNDIMQQQIQGAAAMGGATGNRFGTSTERNFGEIGRQAGNELTSMLSNLLYNQTQADQDRALTATGMGLEDSRFRNQLGFQGQQNAFDRALQSAGMGMGAAGMEEQMAQDRLRLPFQIGSWEQGRQDGFAGQAYQDFERNKLGWLPAIMGLLGGQGGTGGMQGQFGVQQTAGSPGFIDYAAAFAPYLGLFMAEGGAAGHRAGKILSKDYY